MNILKDVCWGLITARGGSKSVPMKNLAQLAGRPLMDYCVLAAKAANSVSRIICSTDSDEIGTHCDSLGIEVIWRPAELAEDSSPTTDVVNHFAQEVAESEAGVPEMVDLLQPTSPFVLPEQIDTCMEKLRTVPDAASVQTVSRCRHHSHAYNQRIIENDYVRFRFGEERRTAHNKQAKPVHFILGNFIGFRLQAALEQESSFPEPSLPIEIAPAHALDADGPWDFQLGEAMLEAGMVKLPHLD